MLLSAVCLAQNYSIGCWTTGAGGTSAADDYSLSGTIGQSVAGTTMTNGDFSLNGGFWALPVAVQSTGAPLLAIVQAGPGQARISWATGSPGFVLQFSPTLNPPAWTNALSGVTNPVMVPATLPTAFYRLIKP